MLAPSFNNSRIYALLFTTYSLACNSMSFLEPIWKGITSLDVLVPQLFCKVLGFFPQEWSTNWNLAEPFRECFVQILKSPLFHLLSFFFVHSSFIFKMVEVVDCDKGGSKRLATKEHFSAFPIALTSWYFFIKVRTRLLFVSSFLDFVDCDVEAVELETAPLSSAALSRLAIGVLVTTLSNKNQIKQWW